MALTQSSGAGQPVFFLSWAAAIPHRRERATIALICFIGGNPLNNRISPALGRNTIAGLPPPRFFKLRHNRRFPVELIRSMIKYFAFALLLCIPGFSPPSFAEAPEGRQEARRPNIIFIQADDLGYGDVSCYGQKKFQTPNLDRMAAEGLRFTSYYAGNTVCAP